MKINSHLIFILLFIVNTSFAQIQKTLNFSFIDKYGCLIKVQSLSEFPRVIDSVFIKTNINSKLIEPGLLIDTAVNSYRFDVYEISSLGINIFNVKIHIEILSLPQKKKNDSTFMSLGQKKRQMTSAYNNYSMSVKMINGKYIIDKFKYINTQI